MRILISGASIAGPVLAYWLTRAGFDATVVERAPTLRKTGGHAVDLFRPSMAISAKMDVLPRIEALATGTDTMTIYREGQRRPIRVDLTKLTGAASDQHVEIMRDDLSEVYYDAGRDDVEYVFGDSIAAISPEGEVTFEHAPPRRFDIVVGADGLHSNVRHLVFGDEAGLTQFIGGYLAVVSAPKTMARHNEMLGHLGVGRLVAVYTAAHLDDARIVFMFRSKQQLEYDHRDALRQKELLRDAFAGMHPQVDDWLSEIDRTPAFYFDAISQLQLNNGHAGESR
jgi:2-polyprenyl-6-methoxyphenol hydroxylase-like FAD-dependent oxidoreductase